MHTWTRNWTHYVVKPYLGFCGSIAGSISTGEYSPLVLTFLGSVGFIGPLVASSRQRVERDLPLVLALLESVRLLVHILTNKKSTRIKFTEWKIERTNSTSYQPVTMYFKKEIITRTSHLSYFYNSQLYHLRNYFIKVIKYLNYFKNKNFGKEKLLFILFYDINL